MHLLLVATLGIASLLPGLAAPTPTEAAALSEAARNTRAYVLPPDALRKATALHRIEETLTLSEVVWTPLQLILILGLGWSGRFRDWADRLSGGRWVRGAAFVLMLLLTATLLQLPFSIYGHHVALRYGLSVQGWPLWAWDTAKWVGVEWLIGTPIVVGILRAIRASPNRWWLLAWPVGVLVALAGVLATPYLLDPLFHRFEPLAQVNPALVQQLERVVRRSGVVIPPERMFVMQASGKETGLNAYVTGFGPSKRIVVWDTTIAHSTTPEILFVFAHELGHYALGHVLIGIALACFGLLPLFWLTHLGTRALLRRWAGTWRIGSMHDLAAVPALLLVASLLSTLADPVSNAISRRMEHNADVYGQEAVHTILPEGGIQALGVASFQVLGETSFDDPAPHPIFDAWFATHPSIESRAAFAAAYDPWAPGAAPKYFPR